MIFNPLSNGLSTHSNPFETHWNQFFLKTAPQKDSNPFETFQRGFSNPIGNEKI